MASVLLPWRLGGGRALDLCVSGRSIDAEEAKRIGLIHQISDDPGQEFLAFFSQNIKILSASSLRIAEKAVRTPLRLMMERDLPALERLYIEDLMQTHDANEGITAFLEKRAPRFATESVN